MLDIRYWLIFFIGKVIAFFAQLWGSGGTAAPGLIVLKLDNNFLIKSAKLFKYSILITGTNGKTTTTRLMSNILKHAEMNYISNRTGSNLERGIVSAILSQVKIFNRANNIIGLWEVDEAALPSVVQQLKPKVILINNLFRDQMDRYGEIDTLAKKWRQAILKLSPESIIILNSDDPTVASLGKKIKNKVYYFGLNDNQIASQQLSHASDATMCPNCLLPLEYQRCFISHMGHYYCRKCGHIQPKLDFSAQNIKISDNSIKLNIKYQNTLNSISTNLTGTYNAYNLLAAVSISLVLKIPISPIIAGIKNFQPAFGRLETLKFKDKVLKIMLIKNPTGFNQIIQTIKAGILYKNFVCLLVLNDFIADGRDVSWIWDVDIENLTTMSNLQKIIVSGTRAEDIALRVKYTNFQFSRLDSAKRAIFNFQVEKNLTNAVNSLLGSNTKNLFILPTYTAMLEVRKILNKKGLVHSTWKD